MVLSKINAKYIIGLYELLESLRCSGREKHDTRLVKITLESAVLLKYFHCVPQAPFKILGALHSKVCNGLIWVSAGRCVGNYNMLYFGCPYKVMSCYGAVTFWHRRSGFGADGRCQHANTSSESGLERMQL